MKYSGFHIACHGVALLFAIFVITIAGFPPSELNASSWAFLLLAVALFLIPYGKRFVLFKVFEWERHDDGDKAKPSATEQ